MPDHLDLTAEQIKLINDLLVPVVKDALHAEFERLRQELTDAIQRRAAADDDRFRAVESRVADLEILKWKAVAAWGVIVLVGTWAFNAGWDYLKTRLFGAR